MEAQPLSMTTSRPKLRSKRREDVALFLIISNILSMDEPRQCAADVPDVALTVHGGEEEA